MLAKNVATILIHLIEERIVHTGIMVGLPLPTWLYNEPKIMAQTRVNFFLSALQTENKESWILGCYKTIQFSSGGYIKHLL